MEFFSKRDPVQFESKNYTSGSGYSTSYLKSTPLFRVCLKVRAESGAAENGLHHVG